MHKAYLFYIILFIFSAGLLKAQESNLDSITANTKREYKRDPDPKYKPNGYFIEGKAQIGLKIHYSLSLIHPSEMQVVFPDSSFQFSPFEFEGKQYYTTKTTEGMSLDSVVYELSTYEVDSIQELELPVFIIHERDCTAIYPEKDAILLDELIKSNRLDTLKYREIVNSQNLEAYFNYPYLILGILLFAVLVFIIWVLLGNRIVKAIKLYQFRLKHSRFLRDYTRLSTRIKIKQSPDDIEKALTIWKKHLEYIEDEPFSTYTSKEISIKIPDEKLSNTLKGIDRAIYGKELSEEIENSMTLLKDYSINFFERKQKEMQNA